MQIILPESRRPIDLNVTIHDGRVVLQFSRDIAELVLEPQEAAELAQALAEITRTLIRRNQGDA